VTRFGVLGTGYWADVCHASGIAAHPDAELVGIWGRDPAKTAALAAKHGVEAYAEVDGLFDDVDAVSLAVPPDVQVELAVQAARAGCALLLEKPLALSADEADRVAGEVDRAGVASVVFFTQRFAEPVDVWLREVGESDWDGGWGAFITTSLAANSPFSHSPWRREYGGLWDLAPHLLALVIPALGPVEEIVAVQGRRDAMHLVLRHEGDRTSQITLTATAPAGAERLALELWGPEGFSAAPLSNADVRRPYDRAVAALIGAIESGVRHPCSVRFGAEVVHVIEAAAHQAPTVVA